MGGRERHISRFFRTPSSLHRTPTFIIRSGCNQPAAYESWASLKQSLTLRACTFLPQVILTWTRWTWARVGPPRIHSILEIIGATIYEAFGAKWTTRYYIIEKRPWLRKWREQRWMCWEVGWYISPAPERFSVVHSPRGSWLALWRKGGLGGTDVAVEDCEPKRIAARRMEKIEYWHVAYLSRFCCCTLSKLSLF